MSNHLLNVLSTSRNVVFSFTILLGILFSFMPIDVHADRSGLSARGAYMENNEGYRYTYNAKQLSFHKKGSEDVVLSHDAGLSNGNHKITNVADGEADSDAVTVRQLRSFAGAKIAITSTDDTVTINESTKDGVTTYDLKVDSSGLAEEYYNKASVEDLLSNQYNELSNKISESGANSAALAGLRPIQYDPLRPTQIMVAIGGYQGTHAVAIGALHYCNASMMLHAGIAVSKESPMYNMGATWRVGWHHAKQKGTDTYQEYGNVLEEMKKMRERVSQLEQANARLKERIGQLEKVQSISGHS